MNRQVSRHSLTMTQAADYAQHRQLELQGRFLWGAGQAAHSLHVNSMFRCCQRWQLLHDFVQEKRRWTHHDEFLDVLLSPLQIISFSMEWAGNSRHRCDLEPGNTIPTQE